MDIILNVFLPLSLAFIMFSLGLGLTFGDFSSVASHPRPFIIGAVSQILLLPLTAFALLHIFTISPELSVGVMILALSPGGVTSNILTKLAGGALALSITLTAIVSLLAVITVPLMVAWSADYFMGQAAPDINVTSLAIAMFMITVVPVLIGLLLRHFSAALAIRLESIVTKIATALFIIIVIGALAANWKLFVANIAVLGPMLITLNILLLLLGWFFARMLRLDHKNAVAIAIETGVQNSSIGITVGSLIVESVSGLPPFSLPSGVYGITMYFVALPFVYWMRTKRVG